ncbi:hypothetical protein T01_15061 [Trichinella spiralis]|uniref:C2H2-type domain-containing protein n=1 Tax=Trichinella spiralis TaxID=6334 RepID=A0A0V1B5Z4_TRISP|nr:hypothetical protein T01_15061 [Trichinella spiralis]
MGKRKNSQSEQDKSSLPTSGTEKPSTKPPPPPPAAIAAAAAAIAAAAATAGGDDLYTKSKIYGEVVKQLRDGASPSTVFQMSNEPQPLDLRKKTDKDRLCTNASTSSSSSRANKDSVRKPRTARKRKSTELPSTSSTCSSQPQIPLSHFFKTTPRSPEIPDSPQISSSEAISNVEKNATASILYSLLQKGKSPSSTMPAASNPSSSVFPKNDNYPLVNPHQTGNQRTDVSLAQQALVNNQQMPAPSNSNSSISSKNDSYQLVNLLQIGNQRTDVSLAQQALVNNQQMPAPSNLNPSMFPQNDNYLLLSLRKVEIPRTDVTLTDQAPVNNQQMPAPSNPNSSISSKNDNYPLVNPHQTGNQRTDVSLTQQALVNNQQMPAPSNPNSSMFPQNDNYLLLTLRKVGIPRTGVSLTDQALVNNQQMPGPSNSNSSISSKNDNYQLVNLLQIGNQRTDVSLAQQALVNNQQMPAPSNSNSSIFSKNDNYPLVNPPQTGNQRTDVSLAQQALVNKQQMPAPSNSNSSIFSKNDNYQLVNLLQIGNQRNDVSLAQQALVNNQQMPAPSNSNSSIFSKNDNYPLVNPQQTGNQRSDVSLAQQALVNKQQMPAASNPSNSIFPKNDNYPLVSVHQTGNERTDVTLAEQASVVKPHPIRVDAFQHPIPFSSAFASYIAGMQHGVHLPPSLSNFQQSMNIPNCSARDISSVDDYCGTTSKMNFSVNLYLAMRMFVDALVQADNYIIGYSGYSICHLCGEKFNIYLLFIYHTVVHCCEILEFEKHNFVIWNLFVADYISVVNYAIPMPFEIMLSMEQMRSRQNLTSSDKLRNDPIRSQRGKENECITERDERFTSGTSESEHQKHHINISYLLQCMLAGCSQTQTAPECFKNASSPTTIQEHNLSFANINQLKRATTTLATNAACFFVHFDGCSIIDSVSMISVSEYYCKYDSFLPDDCCITLMIEDGSNFDGNFEAVLHSSTVMESNYTANATSNYVNTGSIDGTNKRSDSGGVSQTDHQQSGFLPYCGERSIHLTQASEQLPPEQSTVNSNSTETKQNSRKRRGRIPKAQLSKQQKSNQQIASSDQSKEAVTVQNCEEKDAVVKNAHENLPNANSSQLAFHSNNTSPQTNYSNNQLNNSGITCPALTEPDASNKKRLSDALANAYQLKAYYDALFQRNINDHSPSVFTRNQNCVLPVTSSMEYNYTANATSNYANDGSNSGGLPRSDNLLPRFHPYSDDRSRRSKLLKAACPQKQMENQQSALSDQPNSHFPYKVCSICTFRAFYNAFPPPNFNEYLQRALSCNQNCVLPVVTDPKVSISSNNLPVITSSANNSQSMPLASRACENTYSNNQKKSTETQWGMGLTTKDKAFSDTLQVEMPPPPSGLANYMSSQNNTIQAVNSSTIDLQSAQSRPSGANTLACNNNFMMPKLNNNFQPHGTSANPLNWERVFSGFPFFKCYVCNASFGDYYAFKMHAQLHSKPIQTDMISNFLGTSAMLQNSAFSPPGASSVALPRSNYPPYYKQSNIIGGHEQMPLGKPNYPMLNSELYSAFTNFQQGGGAGNLRYGNPSPVMAQANFPNYGQDGIVNQKGIYGQQPSVASDILNPQNANASSFPGLG